MHTNGWPPPQDLFSEHSIEITLKFHIQEANACYMFPCGRPIGFKGLKGAGTLHSHNSVPYPLSCDTSLSPTWSLNLNSSLFLISSRLFIAHSAQESDIYPDNKSIKMFLSYLFIQSCFGHVFMFCFVSFIVDASVFVVLVWLVPNHTVQATSVESLKHASVKSCSFLT